MTGIGPMPPAPTGHARAVRPAFRMLGRAHASVAGLFDAVTVLDDTRRAGNASTKGRMSRVEVDVLRSAVVFTSAGLDAAMKRLVNDVGRLLIPKQGSGARAQYREFLKAELAKPNVAEAFRDAVMSEDVSESLMAHYLSERTKASFQGSGELKVRVRQTLGISRAKVPDLVIDDLDEFFQARNQIAHQMDLKDTSSKSIARTHRTPDEVARMCTQVFDVAAALVRGAASAMKKTGA